MYSFHKSPLLLSIAAAARQATPFVKFRFCAPACSLGLYAHTDERLLHTSLRPPPPSSNKNDKVQSALRCYPFECCLWRVAVSAAKRRREYNNSDDNKAKKKQRTSQQ